MSKRLLVGLGFACCVVATAFAPEGRDLQGVVVQDPVRPNSRQLNPRQLNPRQLNPRQQDPIGLGPAWGGGQPEGRNAVFATSDGCARCHSAAPHSHAMLSPLGEDVSPHATWQATVMANSFRDPYWRAQVARECELNPEGAAEVQALCIRCHAPMHHHTRVLGGQPPTTMAEAAKDPLARDGVSCSMCHQIRARHLGEETTFSGKPRIGRSRVIYGPYKDPDSGPMLGMSRYAAMHGEHISRSALCATCHTLVTHHQGRRFPEQTPYFEWRNSIFSDEAGKTEQSQTCQECHMANIGATRIARDPTGVDFMLKARDPYRAHAFVGGNAMLLEMLADNRKLLGVKASAEDLRKMARATRRQLTTATVDVEISVVEHLDSELRFQVKVTNKTGHKFPTGYPARRAWLHVRIENENGTVFDCGGFTTDGEIVDVISAQDQPHITRIEAPDEVLIWELVPQDEDGDPTTALTEMSMRGKDNRLLPKGWRPDGPHAKDTQPIGLGDDPDFVAGSDTVDLAVPYAMNEPTATVIAWVHYQPIPPHWVADLRDVDADECRTFIKIYDAADKTPETVGAAVRIERL
ncbi:MAG: hypothetical protein ACJAYX_002772 [Planctomycetota bacterium]|jgi:hypothetical protein